MEKSDKHQQFRAISTPMRIPAKQCEAPKSSIEFHTFQGYNIIRTILIANSPRMMKSVSRSARTSLERG